MLSLSLCVCIWGLAFNAFRYNLSFCSFPRFWINRLYYLFGATNNQVHYTLLKEMNYPRSHFYDSVILNIFPYYRPQTKLREGNVFTGVCDSLHRGGCLVLGGSGPGGCLVETPPRTATAAGGTHPTGMHSCWLNRSTCIFNAICWSIECSSLWIKKDTTGSKPKRGDHNTSRRMFWILTSYQEQGSFVYRMDEWKGSSKMGSRDVGGLGLVGSKECWGSKRCWGGTRRWGV